MLSLYALHPPCPWSCQVSTTGAYPGFPCAGLWQGCKQAGPGRKLALEAMLSPSPCLRSRAPLRHCPTKSSAAVIAEKKQPTPQAERAGSSSARNDCWALDLHGDNFELLSALKPCSLLCSGNEMCGLPLPGSPCSPPVLAGGRLCNSSACPVPHLQKGLPGVGVEDSRDQPPRSPGFQLGASTESWSRFLVLMFLLQFLFGQCSCWHPAQVGHPAVQTWHHCQG